ncbi:hypothetical protein CN97_00800 [Haematobacter massiliensis]|uniref:Terminase small subunit n=1 Tax=Haematobacter massiliensis TaxID=195105 RepID=A0A086Y0E9_9RHOB|nr:terminase small subunit [Haematobacter massiliensis]KFI27749.1 hypothetical protein CN97_00800 [Haematobacter massiliensis]OWJ82722.1 terminase small subunit [Haematobacter massiliensis]
MADPDKGPGKLTPKQALFVAEYLKDLNATQAAIRAGYAHPTTQGPRLLENVGVMLAIEAAQAERVKRVQVDADWVLSRLSDEATADLADILDEAGAIKPVKDWPLIWRQGLVAGVDVHEEIVEGVKVGQTVKVKLSDRIKRIELIGKHVSVGAFKDQVEHSGGVTVNISGNDADL